jgi:hypothetical protein
MSKAPPVRQDPLAGAPAPIAAEVQAQIDARKHRRGEERRQRRPKATYDLSLPIQEAIEEISAAESIARSDVVALAMVRLVADYRAGALDLSAQKERARSLRYDWKLILPPEFA